MASERVVTCLCDSRYEGCEHDRPCGAHVTDRRWGPWCSDCNPRRFAHINARLEQINRALSERPR